MKGRIEVGGLGLSLRAMYDRLHTHTQGRRRHLHVGMPPGTSGFMVAIDLGAGGCRRSMVGSMVGSTVRRSLVLGRIARRMCQPPIPSWVPAEVSNILNLPLGECVILAAGALGATGEVSKGLVGGGQTRI